MTTFSYAIENGVAVVPIHPGLVQADWFSLRDWFSRELLHDGERARILVDCSGVIELPSIAFGVFCTVARDVDRAGGRFCLLVTAEPIMEVIQRTRIDRIMTVCRSADAARAHLAGDA